MAGKSPTLTFDMDSPCAECRKPGATPCGLCMKCATKAMFEHGPLKSAEARGVRKRWAQELRNGQ